jgi:hypothetical protein
MDSRQERPQDHLSVLPAELLLQIVDEAEPESQLVLTMVSRRLRDLIYPSHNLGRCKFPVRVKFLRLLEKDYPQLLLCEDCGILWPWRKYCKYRICCPQVAQHPWGSASSWEMRGCGGSRSMFINADIIRLVLRAQECGGQYGLPLEMLNGGRKSVANREMRSHEARIVDGRIVLASVREVYLRSSWTDGKEEIWTERVCVRDLCLHLGQSEKVMVAGGLARLPDVVRAAREGKGLQIFKCWQCESDFDLMVERSRETDSKVTLRAWRRYDHPRTFRDPGYGSQIRNNVAGRDIKALFDRQEPASHQG